MSLRFAPIGGQTTAVEISAGHFVATSSISAPVRWLFALAFVSIRKLAADDPIGHAFGVGLVLVALATVGGDDPAVHLEVPRPLAVLALVHQSSCHGVDCGTPLDREDGFCGGSSRIVSIVDGEGACTEISGRPAADYPSPPAAARHTGYCGRHGHT